MHSKFNMIFSIIMIFMMILARGKNEGVNDSDDNSSDVGSIVPSKCYGCENRVYYTPMLWRCSEKGLELRQVTDCSRWN